MKRRGASSKWCLTRFVRFFWSYSNNFHIIFIPFIYLYHPLFGLPVARTFDYNSSLFRRRYHDVRNVRIYWTFFKRSCNYYQGKNLTWRHCTNTINYHAYYSCNYVICQQINDKDYRKKLCKYICLCI